MSDVTVEALHTLKTACQSCQDCRLATTRQQVVFGEGSPHAQVFIIGEGPGADEDASGRPFVGRSGQLLDQILAAVGLSRNEVYIANMVKCRPPANRVPQADEVAACSHWLHSQLATVQPKVIVTLGNTPSRHILGLKQGTTKTRGQWLHYSADWGAAYAMPMYHPAYLLRNPSRLVGSPKSLTWRDIREVKAVLMGKDPFGQEPNIEPLEVPDPKAFKASEEPDHVQDRLL